MADNLKISKVDPNAERVDELARSDSEKLQSLAKQLVSSLYMLVRSAKLYDPDNAIFNKPLELLKETINTIIASDGQLVLQVIKESFYLNNMLVKVDFGSLDNVRFLTKEFKEREVGGFVLQRPIPLDELRNFVWIFSKEQQDATEEDGVAGRKLVNIKVSKWKQIKEKVETDDSDLKVDRKKYALTIYARLVFFMRRYLDRLSSESPLSPSKAGRLVQDMVDICFEQRNHFLGMTTMDDEKESLVYHSVNVCLISVVFGSELGLTKPQLKELGTIGLFHDVGMAVLDDKVYAKRGALNATEKKEVAKAPLYAVRNILERGGISRSEVARLVATIEHHEDFGRAVRNSRGEIDMVIPRSDLAIYSKILAIVNTYDALTSKRPYRDAYGPEIALTLMWTEMRHKFDPDLLQIFMQVMAIQPVKIVGGKQTISLG
jgi:HD-GYP domain-containing protein (c-di-GMP phosphodiesterase class II)